MSDEVASRKVRRTVRFFRAPGADRAVAREEFASLALHGRAALADAIKRFERGEERSGEVQKLPGTDELWEIRVKVGTDPFRALFFYDTGSIVICLTAFYKNQRKTPPADLKRAATRKRAWEDEGKRRQREKDDKDRQKS